MDEPSQFTRAEVLGEVGGEQPDALSLEQLIRKLEEISPGAVGGVG